VNPVYHLQFGWLVGNLGEHDRRERRLLMLAAVSADLDGIFIWSRQLFERMHHTFGHNIFYGLAIGAIMAVFAKSGRRGRIFILSYLMALSGPIIDLVTSPAWPVPLFWPFSRKGYYLTEMLNISAQAAPAWNFALEKVVQITLMVVLLGCTVCIYVKFRRTFLELISANLDRFLTDFAILPFRHRCDAPDCGNRAHYRCRDTDSVRCIKHCAIHRDLTVTCIDADGKNSTASRASSELPDREGGPPRSP